MELPLFRGSYGNEEYTSKLLYQDRPNHSNHSSQQQQNGVEMDFVFGLRNNNTKPCNKYRLVGTTHLDYGSSNTGISSINNSTGNTSHNNGFNSSQFQQQQQQQLQLQLQATSTTTPGGVNSTNSGGIIVSNNNSNSNLLMTTNSGTNNNTYMSNSTNTTNNIATTNNNNSISNNNNSYYSSRSVSWNSTGTLLAVASSSATIRLVNIEVAVSVVPSTTTTTTGSTLSNPTATGTSSLLLSGSNTTATAASTTATIASTTTPTTTTTSELYQLAAKDVVTITGGHTAPVVKVRFHPMEPNLLCSAGMDKIIQVWDVRNAIQRSVGKIDIHIGTAPISMEWGCNTSNLNIVQVTECDNTIYIYDVRKLSSPLSSSTSTTSATISSNTITPIAKDVNNTSSSSSSTSTAALRTFRMKPNMIETCMFTPDGDHLITGSTSYGGEGIGELKIFPWKYLPFTKNATSYYYNNNNSNKRNDTTTGDTTVPSTTMIYPAHAGPIYAMAYSPNGQYMATGGCDSNVSVWEVQQQQQNHHPLSSNTNPNTMHCVSSISRRTKFIRSVAFSNNNQLLAISTEEDTIDLSYIPTGECIGIAPFTTTTTTNMNASGRNYQSSSSSIRNNSNNSEGAEEIVFHPKESYLLACARTTCNGGNSNSNNSSSSSNPLTTSTTTTSSPPVTILKLNIV